MPLPRSSAITLATALLATAMLGVQPAGATGETDSFSGSYLAGRSASRARDVEAATGYVSEALKLDPENIALIERLFQLNLAAGQIASAEAQAERVIRFNSEHRMARTVLGLKAMRSGKMDEAREHFTESAYTPVGELTAALLQAWSYAGEKNLNAAMKELQKLESNDSFANFQSFHEALIADFLASQVRAEAAYKRAVEAANGNLRVTQAYGSFLRRNGKASAAEKLYNDFLAADPNNLLIGEALAQAKANVPAGGLIQSAQDGAGEALFSIAAAMNDGDSADVALIYAQLAQAFSSDTGVMNTLLADIQTDMERYEDAIKTYERVPKSSPLSANAETEISLNLHRLGRSKEAQDRLKSFLNAQPDSYSAWVTLGNIHRNNETFVEARDAYSKAIAMFGKTRKADWQIYYYRGICNERLKAWTEAESDFREALKLSPDEASVLNYLGYSLIDAGKKLDEAIAMVKKAVELRPNDGYIIDSLGWAYYRLGDYEEAVKHLERAVELRAGDPTIADHLGDAYWRVGRKLEAQFQWQHAKDNDPEPEDLKRIEKKIKDGLADEPLVEPAENGEATPSNG